MGDPVPEVPPVNVALKLLQETIPRYVTPVSVEGVASIGLGGWHSAEGSAWQKVSFAKLVSPLVQYLRW
jgi:hypothetical protein